MLKAFICRIKIKHFMEYLRRLYVISFKKFESVSKNVELFIDV